MTRNNTTWEEFASRVRSNQIGFMGEPNEVKPGRGEFHENPTSCICENSKEKTGRVLLPQNQTNNLDRSGKEDSTNQDSSDNADEQLAEDEQDGSDMDYLDNAKVLPNGKLTSHRNSLLKLEQPELEEELFSD